MQNYNQQQQAVILKGIAQQILSMNVPSFSEVNKLFQAFGQDIVPTDLWMNSITKPVDTNYSAPETMVTNSEEDEALSWYIDKKLERWERYHKKVNEDIF